MDVTRILIIYATVCLAAIPVEIAMLALLSRKTKLLAPLDNWIDKVLGEGDKDDRPEQVTNSVPGHIQDEEPLEECENRQRTPTFQLQVGDTYHCHVGTDSQDSRMYELRWYSRNEFVGTIDDDAVFSALKAGRVTVGCARRHDDFDTGSDIYEIEVLPANRKWTGDKYINLLATGSRKDVFLSSLSPCQIISEDKESDAVTIKVSDTGETVAVRFDSSGRVAKVLLGPFILTPGVETDLVKELDERFRAVRTTGEALRLWARLRIDESREEVELYAMIRKYPDGRGYLGLSRFWRDHGEYDEFVLNIGMAERTFAGLLPEGETVNVKTRARRARTRKPVHATRISAAENPSPDTAKNKIDETIKEAPAPVDVTPEITEDIPFVEKNLPGPGLTAVPDIEDIPDIVSEGIYDTDPDEVDLTLSETERILDESYD